ncbi:MAG: hypothetical protein WCY24_01995 [Lutispora sp.]|nr:hypothetical protein [Lutispora sp.]MDD4833693.1 hypothetical protein [Lutispora sp.]
MKNKKTDFGKMEDELADVSLYGEFVSTFHNWVSSERQKSKVKELEDISEEK